MDETPETLTIESIITRGEFTTPEDFSAAVEEYVKRTFVSHLEGLYLFCEENGWDAVGLAKSLTPQLKSKIQHDATRLNLLKPKRTRRRST
jgi:hypothetical protein